MTTHVLAKAANSTAREVAAARGVVFIHACPKAVSPHLDWALSSVFDTSVHLDWNEQPIAPNMVRAELLWQGPLGMGSQIASALLAFGHVRYEVTEDANGNRAGERFAVTPTLGLFRADIGEHGDVMVAEERLRTALSQAAVTGDGLAEEIARLIGSPWDEELEPFRCAHEGSTLRVLHDVI